VIGVTALADAVGFLTGLLDIEPTTVDVNTVFAVAGKYDVDFSDVRGQESVKRALTVAAAGHHNILMIGPPGSGKTMLAKRIPTILPPLTPEESLETTRIYSSRGLLARGQSLMATRPVRTPHHSSSSAALVGGGVVPQPGEISLAHHGVLFLDEFPEFNRTTLEMIRQPLEDGCVTIPRVHSTMKFPAAIMLVAAMNPCPCGYATDPKRQCKCGSFVIERYLARVSGPLIDRIDIHVEVPPVSWKQLRAEGPAAEGMTSQQMRDLVQRAREVQRRRFGSVSVPARDSEDQVVSGGGAPEGDSVDAVSSPPSVSTPGPVNVQRGGFHPGPAGEPAAPARPDSAAVDMPASLHRSAGTITNATMSSRQVRTYCKLDAAGEALLKQAVTELGLSARAHDKVLRIARTIADLEGSDRIESHHLAEAIQYRRLDRKL
ncbi:MAG TPA: ATP-binding protein, partial [Phycisphaerae bacterium]|nr:ATP-binding protein [Phycisphaerae bacterium]